MSKTKVSSRGQTVIPKVIRQRYGIKKGSEVEWQAVDAYTIMIQKVQPRPKTTWLEWLKSVEGLHKGVWKGVDPVEYTREQRRRGNA